MKRIQLQPVSFDNCRSLNQSIFTARVMHYYIPYRCWKHRRNLTVVIANRQTKHNCESADIERDKEIWCCAISFSNINFLAVIR